MNNQFESIENNTQQYHHHHHFQPPNSTTINTTNTITASDENNYEDEKTTTTGGGYDHGGGGGGILDPSPAAVKAITNFSGIYSREEVLILHRLDYPIPESFPSEEDITSKTPLKPVASFKYRREFENSQDNYYNSSEGNFFSRGSGRAKGRGRGRGRRDTYSNWDEEDKISSGRGGGAPNSRGGRGPHKQDDKPWRKKDDETFGDNLMHKPDSKKLWEPDKSLPPSISEPTIKAWLPINTPAQGVSTTSPTNTTTGPNPNTPSSIDPSSLTPAQANAAQALLQPGSLSTITGAMGGLHPSESNLPPSESLLMTTPLSEIALEEKWYYKDPKGTERGPFGAIQMDKWLKHNFFKVDLFVRRERDHIFMPLGFFFLSEQRNPFTSVPLAQWIQGAPTEFKNGLYLLQNHQRSELLRQEQMLRNQQIQLQQILQSVKLESSTGQSDGPIFGPSKTMATNPVPPTMLSHSNPNINIPSALRGGPPNPLMAPPPVGQMQNPIHGMHMSPSLPNFPLVNKLPGDAFRAHPDPNSPIPGMVGGPQETPNLGQNINQGGYNWNTAWSQQNQQYLQLMRLHQMLQLQQQQQRTAQGNLEQQQQQHLPNVNFLNDLNKDPKLAEMNLSGSPLSQNKVLENIIKSDKLVNPIPGNIAMNQAKLKTGSLGKDQPLPPPSSNQLDPSTLQFPTKSKSSPWLNPSTDPSISSQQQIDLHKSDLIPKPNAQQQQQQQPYLNVIPGTNRPIWPNYPPTENKPPTLSPWPSNEPSTSTSIWYNGPVPQAAGGSNNNPWKTSMTPEDSGPWKNINNPTEQQQQQQQQPPQQQPPGSSNFLAMQEEQNKTLREIVAQMNQVKNSQGNLNLANLVGLDIINKEESSNRGDKSNVYSEQDRSLQQKEKSLNTPKQQQQQSSSSLPQPSPSSSAWKTLSSKDIPKSFADIQKEEEQQKITRDYHPHHHHQVVDLPDNKSNESPWGVPKATATTTDSSVSLQEIQHQQKREHVKKQPSTSGPITTQHQHHHHQQQYHQPQQHHQQQQHQQHQQPQHQQHQQPYQQQQPYQDQSNKQQRAPTQKQPHSSGNRNMKHSK